MVDYVRTRAGTFVSEVNSLQVNEKVKSFNIISAYELII